MHDTANGSVYYTRDRLIKTDINTIITCAEAELWNNFPQQISDASSVTNIALQEIKMKQQ